MTTPAVRAAALDPRPLPSGMSLWISSSTGGSVPPTSRATVERSLPDQVLVGRREYSPQSRPDTEMRSDSLQPEPAFEIDPERQPKRIETRAEIRAGCRNADSVSTSYAQRDLLAAPAGSYADTTTSSAR